MDPCWYVSQTWGVHDQRWVAALHAQGFQPRVLSCERDGLTIKQVREQLAASGDDAPVLAGPLTSVTTQLIGIDQPLIGLSWGFDLLDVETPPSGLDRLDHLIVDSPVSADIALTAGVPPERITTIYWGTDPSTFTPDGPATDLSSFGVPVGSLTALSLRAHEELYRVSDVIDAWPSVLTSVPNAQLLIGNSGSTTEYLKSRVRDLGISDSVHFIGALPEDQLPAVLRAVDVYVSTSPIDGTSVTLLQAMATGCPVVVTDTQGNRHWVQPDEGGYLYPPGDVLRLAQALTSALTAIDSPEQEVMTQRSLQTVRERADWNINQQKLRSALLPNE